MCLDIGKRQGMIKTPDMKGGKAAGGPVDIGVKPFYTSTKVTGKVSLPGLQIMLTLARRHAFRKRRR